MICFINLMDFISILYKIISIYIIYYLYMHFFNFYKILLNNSINKYYYDNYH
jgi:hypothetical protein